MASLRRSVIASVLFTVFGGPGILLVLVPWLITRFRIPADQPRWHVVLAAALICAGLVPAFESIVRFVIRGHGSLVPTLPPQHLVVSGLYRYVRNPMYVGVFTVLAGEALLTWSHGLLVELALACVSMELFVRFYEEPTLARTFGDEYAAFRRNVPRWWPRFTPWRGPSS